MNAAHLSGKIIAVIFKTFCQRSEEYEGYVLFKPEICGLGTSPTSASLLLLRTSFRAQGMILKSKVPGVLGFHIYGMINIVLGDRR